MRRFVPLLLGGLLLGAAPAAAADRIDREAELARALEGRVAGEPVSCINLHRVRGTRIVTDTAILYEAGSTIYVNRPTAGSRSLNQWDALVTRTPSSQLCSVDTVTTVDLNAQVLRGVVFLGEFVPYRRVRD